MTGEATALLVSTMAAVVLGVIALGVALATGSSAILLDGTFNLCFFVSSLVTLRVLRLLERPDNAGFPFGDVQFEPLINVLEGLLSLGVNLVALIESTFATFRGGSAVAAGLALGYAAFGVIFGAAALTYLRRAARRFASPLLTGDVDNWTVNLAISGGMLAAFGLALVLQRTEAAALARDVDPILVSLVVVLTAPVPTRMAYRGLMALVKRAPDAAVSASIESLLRSALAEVAMRALHVRVVQPGRSTYLLVHVLLRDDALGLEVRRADQLRRGVAAAVVTRHKPAVVDVVFTGEVAFAEPTTGFVVDVAAPPMVG